CVNKKIEVIDAGFEHRILRFQTDSSPTRPRPQQFVKWLRLRNPQNQLRLVDKLNEVLKKEIDPEAFRSKNEALSLLTKHSAFGILNVIGRKLLGVGPRKSRSQLESITERCKGIRLDQIAEIERLNQSDLSNHHKNTI